MNVFDKHIKNKLSDHHSVPPSDMWDRIEKDLDNNKKPGYLWIKTAAAILLLIAGSFTLWQILPETDKKAQTEQLNKEDTNQTESISDAFNNTAISKSVEINNLKNKINKDISPVSSSGNITHNSKSNSYKEEFIQQQPKSLIAGNQIRNTGENKLDKNPGLQDDKGKSDGFIMPAISHQIARDQHTTLSSKQISSISSESSERGLIRPLTENIILANREVLGSIRQTSNDFSPSEKETVDSHTDLGKLSMSAFISPQQSYRYSNNTKVSYSTMESDVLGFSAGLNLTYKITNRFSVRSGIDYSRIGQQVNGIAAFSHPSMINLYSSDGKAISNHPQSMNTSMGNIIFTDQNYYFADLNSARVFTLKGTYDDSNVNLLNKSGMGLLQHFDYLQIPLVAQYEIIQRSFNLAVKTGIKANILQSGNVYLQGSSYFRSVGESTGYNTFNWSASTGLIFAYPLGNNLNAIMEPTFDMFITPVGSSGSANNTYPYNYSLMVGVSYDLR